MKIIIGQNTGEIKSLYNRFEKLKVIAQTLLKQVRTTKDQSGKTKMTTSSSAGRPGPYYQEPLTTQFKQMTDKNTMNIGTKLNTSINNINDLLKQICNEAPKICLHLKNLSIQPPIIPNSSTWQESGKINNEYLKKYEIIYTHFHQALNKLKQKIKSLNDDNVKASDSAKTQHAKFTNVSNKMKKKDITTALSKKKP